MPTDRQAGAHLRFTRPLVKEKDLIDVILVAATFGLFFVNVAFIAGCDHLLGTGRNK